MIGAAQRVEHYEISGYTTAKNLAQQLRHSAIVELLSKSLAEEENSDQLLNQVARTLMSVAQMPAAVERIEANRTPSGVPASAPDPFYSLSSSGAAREATMRVNQMQQSNE